MNGRVAVWSWTLPNWKRGNELKLRVWEETIELVWFFYHLFPTFPFCQLHWFTSRRGPEHEGFIRLICACLQEVILLFWFQKTYNLIPSKETGWVFIIGHILLSLQEFGSRPDNLIRSSFFEPTPLRWKSLRILQRVSPWCPWFVFLHSLCDKGKIIGAERSDWQSDRTILSV